MIYFLVRQAGVQALPQPEEKPSGKSSPVLIPYEIQDPISHLPRETKESLVSPFILRRRPVLFIHLLRRLKVDKARPRDGTQSSNKALN